MDNQLQEKYEALKDALRSYGKVAVAYSSGVDSTFLLKVAHDTLGENAIAVTAISESFLSRESEEANEFCKSEGIEHIKVKTNELETDAFKNNPPDRCYHCKKSIFSKVINIANEHGISVVCDGSNKDDEGDYRPGIKALKELGIESPLKNLGFTKADIRALSKELNLPTWNKSAYACLATRFPYGNPITREGLIMVDKAENFLYDSGFHQVRVRIHGKIARIEVLPEDINKFLDEGFRNLVYDRFKEAGFEYVSLDLKGYRMGSMNEVLK
ncbi:MAG: ATP-dependent sacrificial sulfur transferase LarE [Lachnospiraceae bacterium]|nr:ATP-dependent sacrificial sulfur transferase LarE [Lachnospiraceae bacterium]